MIKTRFKIDITYELKDGFWDTEYCDDCELDPEERTFDHCRGCLSLKLSIPALYAEERVLDSTYQRRVKITPIAEDALCQQVLEDGSICNNGRVFATCLVCKKPFCQEHLGDIGVCGSKVCQEKIRATTKEKEKKKKTKPTIERESASVSTRAS